MSAILGRIALFAASKIGRYVFIGGGFLALVLSFAAHQRNIGYRNAVADVRENNADVQNKAQSAGRKSQSGSGSVQLQFRDD